MEPSLDSMKEKTANIFVSYADLIGNMIVEASKEEAGLTDFKAIDERIRMLHHLAGTLAKLSACDD